VHFKESPNAEGHCNEQHQVRKQNQKPGHADVSGRAKIVQNPSPKQREQNISNGHCIRGSAHAKIQSVHVWVQFGLIQLHEIRKMIYAKISTDNVNDGKYEVDLCRGAK
jgi:hypothetical protein